MVRKIIEIDEEACNGCGLCVNACHEGAIGLIDGKAKLLRDDYCDGLGACLPVCPTGAIKFIEREASEYDEAAVQRNLQEKEKAAAQHTHSGGCPGSAARTLSHANIMGGCPGSAPKAMERRTPPAADRAVDACDEPSQLAQWPVQIKLVPVKAPYFENARLLIAADCAAYAYAGFHDRFMRGKITIIGCPKLDEGDYSEKLTEIIKRNNIKSITLVRMEVPCCGGLEHAVVRALQNSGKMIPWEVVTFSVDGQILED